MRVAIAIVGLLLLGSAHINDTIASAAASQVGVTTIYDPSYVQLRYPGGDLPRQRGRSPPG